MAFSPFKFLQEVRSETVFFFAADQIMRYLVTILLGVH